MSSVDNRIVQMQFDNKQFESGVQTTLKSLSNLKKGLDLDASAKSLSNLEKTGKSFSLAGLASGVETISSKFSTLGIIGVTALQNITNSAVNAGKRIVSALTIDPVKMGFQEYETQINAVQTILANTESKGKTLEDVNKALDELNTYADKTIYNFTEMTRNIGTFTAAGVDLDTSVAAIKGIANLAAVSGSTSQQASTAMYQLSQALASGTVKLMDWNSVVNAGMGGQVFQDALKETARVHGIAIDDMIKSEGSFRETLSKGWLTSEILTETLSKFTGDLNEEQLRTMGYTEEQIKSIMKMGQTANDAATKVKTFSQLFDTLKEAAQSGWTQSWEIIVGDFEEAKELLTEVSNVIGDMIGKSAQARNEMLQGWKDLGGRTALIEAVRNAFRGIMSVIEPVKEAFKEIFPPMTAQKLYELTDKLRNLTANFKMGEETANNLKNTFKGFFSIIKIGIQVVSSLVKGIFSIVGALAPVGAGILSVTGSIGEAITEFSKFVQTSGVIKAAVNAIVNILNFAVNTIGSFIKGITDVFRGFSNVDTSGVEAVGNKIQKSFNPLIALGEGVKKFFTGISNIIKKVSPVFFQIAGKIGEVFGNMGKAIANALRNGDLKAIGDLFNTGIFATILLGIKNFINDIGETTGSIKELLDGVKGSLEAYQQSLKANTLLKIAGAIGILAASLVALSMIDPNKMSNSLLAITTLFTELFTSMAIFEKIMGSKGFRSMGKVTTAMLGLSTAVLILSSAMVNLSKLDFTQIISGLTGIAGMSAILVVSAKALSQSKGKLIKGASGLVLFAVSILVLSNAVKQISSLNLGELTKGLIGVGVLCTELSIFLNNTNFDGMGLFKGAGLLLLAAAINVLATAVGKFGQLDLSTLAKGLISMAASLTIIAGALHIIPKNIGGQSVSLVILASSLLILGNAIKTMGGMSWEEVARGLVTLAGSLTIIAVAMQFMTSALPGAAALLVVAGALAILAPVLALFGNMSLTEIGKGLLTLTGIFVLFGVAGLALSPIVPVMLGLAGAIALLGAGCLAAGAGVMAFAAGLTALGAAGTVGVTALVAAVSAIIGLIPYMIEQIGNGLILLCNIIAGSATSICNAITAVLTGVLGAITNCIPPLLSTLGLLITELLQFLVSKVPEIVDVGLKLLVGFLRGLTQNMGDVIDAGVDVVLSFLKGVSSQLGDVIDTAFKMIINFINGLADAIRNNVPLINAAVRNLIRAIINAMISGVTNMVGVGKDLINGVIKGVGSMGSALANAAKNVAKNALNAIKKALGINSPSKEGIEVGEYVDEGLMVGLKNLSNNVTKSATNVGTNAINGIKDAMSTVASVVDSDAEFKPTISPVLNMSNNNLTPDTAAIDRAMQNIQDKASAIGMELNTETTITHKHTFDTLRIEGVNDKGEFIAVTDYAIEELLTELMRRQNRL